MKTEDLIQHLVAQRPAPRWVNVKRISLIWWASLLIWALLLACYLTFQPRLEGEGLSFSEAVPIGAIGLSSVLVFLFAGTIGHAALCFATPTPGREAKRLSAAALLTFVFLLLTVAIGYPAAAAPRDTWQSSPHLASQHLECPEHLLLVAVFPALGLFLVTRAFGQFSAVLGGAAAFAAAGGAGLLALQLLCPNYVVAHVVTYHLLPLLPLILVGVLVFSAFGGITRQVEALRRKL